MISASPVAHRGLTCTVAVGLSCLLIAAHATAQPPASGYPQDPAQPCAEPSPTPLGSAIAPGPAFIPVPTDPTGYQKCGPAGTPLGIKHCPDGFNFDSLSAHCVPQHATDATVGIEEVWKTPAANPQSCSPCQPTPINVRVSYSGTNIGAATVTLTDPAGTGNIWAGSAGMLTGDGQPHSIVIAASTGVSQSADWPIKPGDQVLVQAYLTDGKPNLDNDPLVVTATTAQTVTASAPPTTP